jgi:large subunit ribosomal protein L19
MAHKLIEIAERACRKGKTPEFHVGDTVDVYVKIVEGAKERVQIFNGVVMARRRSGMNENFTVRRIVNNEGVERTFMLHSPLVLDVKVKRRGKVRRAKLYFLRQRVGKSRRLRELRSSGTREKSVAPAAAASAAPVEELAVAGV